MSEEIESPELDESLLARLKAWEAPTTTAEQTTKLVTRLAEELPRSQPSLWRWAIVLLGSQLKVVRGEIWWASALVMALGLVVTLASPSAGMLPITTLAPLVAAVGVALLYDTDVQQVMELEDATPVSIRLLLLARLTLVFGFDLALALAASVTLAAVQADVSLWPLVMSWLAPMAFLSALAFLLSVVFVDPTVGSLFSLGIWGLHVFLNQVATRSVLIDVLSLPGLAAPENRPWLVVWAVVVLLVALWVVGYSEREARR